LLERNGTTYTFKGDIFGNIWVQTGNITINGAGHTLQGNGVETGQNTDIGILLGGPDLSHRECQAVLVENLRIRNIPTGIFSVGGSNNSVIGNYFETSGMVIQGNANDTGDLIKHNTFVNASVTFDYNPNGTDIITENNFINCIIGVWLSNPPIADKNYWSDYTAKYPDAREQDNTGTGNTPYVFATVQNGTQTISYKDYFPLMEPVTVPDSAFPTPNPSSNASPTPSPSPNPSTTLSPSPSVPEFLFWQPLPLLAGLAAIIVLFRKRPKRKSRLD
jgi:hypothetical protein